MFISGKKKTIIIDMTAIKTPKEFQAAIKTILDMSDFYGMNWDAYWDGITGLISLPDMLVLEGWQNYKELQKNDAELFEEIMKQYNALEECEECECVYR